MANFWGKVKNVICEFSWGKHGSYECCRRVFSGQTGKWLIKYALFLVYNDKNPMNSLVAVHI